MLRAGGDLTRLAAAPEGIVITEPGEDKVETAEVETPKVSVEPGERPTPTPDITPENKPKPD